MPGQAPIRDDVLIAIDRLDEAHSASVRNGSRSPARPGGRAAPVGRSVRLVARQPLAPGHWELRLAAQTRIVSMAGVRLDSRKSIELSTGNLHLFPQTFQASSR